MDYILYLGTNLSFLKIKKVLIYIFNSIDGKEIYEDKDNEFTIGCNWFTLNLNIRSHSILSNSKDYKLSLKFQVWFELLTSVEGSTEMMMYVIGRILEQIEGDTILLSNGDTPILERRNGQVKVDDSKLDGLERFPFNQLGIEYVEGELE